MSPLAPGSVIGILGGGQLGRLMALEAARLGFDVHIYTPESDSPAGRVAAREVTGAYSDTSALLEFARTCDVVTYEFENIPAAYVTHLLDNDRHVAPGVSSLETSQDRSLEKNCLQSIGIPTAPFHEISDATSLEAALSDFDGNGILKTRRNGYDGKGQVRIQAGKGRKAALDLALKVPCILEAYMPFDCEISVVVARSARQTLAYDPSRNIHENGILRRSIVPAGLAQSIIAEAQTMAIRLADALDHIGVITLELFVMPDGSLRANEFAPRVHNSGHWTPEACQTGQFEQHIRAISHWPLGPVTRHHNANLVNIMGEDDLDIPAACNRDARLVSYGKRQARIGRKMGHLTYLSPKVG